MKKAIIVSCVLVSLFFTGAAHAGNWVDDWFQQATYSGAQSFEGQKRGYWTGGNMSIRYNTSNDYLVTASLPKLRAGCGGIDVFLGGFSFLNMDKLGDKFQSIMTAAPSYAFDLALKTVCESCAETYGKLEAIVDRLNNLQINDCKAAKALVTYAADSAGADWKGKDKDVEEMGKYYQESGVKDLYTDASKLATNNPKQAAVDNKSKITSGNPTIEALLYQQGTLLGKVGAQYGISSEWIDLARGYVGDLIMEENDNPFKLRKETPCAKNNPTEGFNDFLSGTAQSKQCTDVLACTCNNASANMLTKVSNHLGKVVTAAENKSPIPADTKDFLERAPTPAYVNILSFLAIKDTASINGLKDKVAVMYSIKQFNDLYEAVYKALNEYTKGVKIADIENSGIVQGPIIYMVELQKLIKEQMVFLSQRLVEEQKLYIAEAEQRINSMSASNDPIKKKILSGVAEKSGGGN